MKTIVIIEPFEKPAAKLTPEVCALRGHPNARAVSGPVPGLVELYCETCDVYFLEEVDPDD